MKKNSSKNPDINSSYEPKVPEIIRQNITQETKFSTERLPKKLLKGKRSKRSKSKAKISSLLSKEYKEDLIDGYDIIKEKIGHSNSFEAKIKNFHTIPCPKKINGMKFPF